jgi:hypothetical protein
MKRIIGIDPGKHGGIVVLYDPYPAEYAPIAESHTIPYKDNRVDTPALREIMRSLYMSEMLFSLTETVVYMESLAHFGIRDQTYAYNYGLIEAICEIRFDVRFASASGGAWQREFCYGVQSSNSKELNSKERVKLACLKIFGTEQCEKYLYKPGRGKSRVFHDGLSDAAGIAYYGWLIEEQKERVTSRVESVNGKQIKGASK